jgi:hypothetical protein
MAANVGVLPVNEVNCPKCGYNNITGATTCAAKGCGADLPTVV